MNINFEDIITKANKRKDDLIVVTNLLEQAPEMLADLKFAMEWVDATALAFGALDQEGRGMLPPVVNGALCSIANTRMYLNKTIWDSGMGQGVKLLAVRDEA